jgi:predicted metal-dependent peptidase
MLKLVSPSRVHLIWWDTKVCKVQTFTPDQYDSVAAALQPDGGGGTMPSCVTDYLLQHREIDATAIVWLTDGDFYEAPHLMPNVPQIWGVIGSHEFRAPKGKVLRIPAV